MLRTIASELQTATDVHLEKVWNEIDKHLQSNQSWGMSRLPSKSEIIDLIHKKRNFSQHSGECPLVDELESYFETSQKFLNKISTVFFGKPINTFSIIDLVESSDYKNLLSLGIEFAEKNDFIKAVAILKLAYFKCSSIFNKSHSCISSDFKSATMEISRQIGNKQHISTKKLEEIFKDINDNFSVLFRIVYNTVKGNLHIPDDRFDALSPHHVSQSMDGTLHLVDHGPSKTADSVEFNYSLFYCVNIICRLESLNLLIPFDFKKYRLKFMPNET